MTALLLLGWMIIGMGCEELLVHTEPDSILTNCSVYRVGVIEVNQEK
jgi:hypothetical protein